MADNLQDTIKRRNASLRDIDQDVEVRPAKTDAPVEPEKKGRLRQAWDALKPREPAQIPEHMLKKAAGGKVTKGYKKGGAVTRGDGIARKGKTKGRMV